MIAAVAAILVLVEGVQLLGSGLSRRIKASR